jgi:hypothetical protein
MFLTDNDVILLDKNSPLFSPLASSIEENCGKMEDRLVESSATTCKTTQQDHHQLSLHHVLRSVISRVKNIRLKSHHIYNNFVCQLWLYLYKIPWYVHSNQSQRYNITDWLSLVQSVLSLVQSVLVSGTHLGLMVIFLKLSLDKLWVCWYGESSLRRGWVCSLQLLLDLASAVFLGPESHGTHDHILLFQIWEIQSKVLHIIVDAPWYVPNSLIQRDLSCPTVKEEMCRYSTHYGDLLRTHPNHLAVNLLRLSDNRRLRRFVPTDLPDRL